MRAWIWWQHRLSPVAETWNGGPHPPQEGSCICLGQVPPPPWSGGLKMEVCTVQTVHFWKNFNKKTQGTTKNGGAGQVRADHRPHPDVQRQIHVQGRLPLVWSLDCMS